MAAFPKISVVIPVRNEEGTVVELTGKLQQVLPNAHEILFVDDGSTDATWSNLTGIHEAERVRLVKLRAPSGKSAALMAGFARCRAPIIFTLDGDLQDDPAEIPVFLSKLEEGYDLVSGWKKVRRDPLHKIAASRVFNFVMRRATGLSLHDMNCGFKCYRAELARSLLIYGDQHRFIPAFAEHMGYRVGEVEVRHHPRRHGRSKYGASRLLKGFLDLGTVLLRTRYRDRPSHAFGLAALVQVVVGLSLYGLSVTRLVHPAIQDGALLGAVCLGSGAAVFLASGWIAELRLEGAMRDAKFRGPSIEETRD